MDIEELLNKVKYGIDDIIDVVISIVEHLTDQEIIDLERFVNAEFYNGDEDNEIIDVPLFRKGIMSVVDGSLPCEEIDASKVVKYLAETNKLNISGWELMKNIELLLNC